MRNKIIIAILRQLYAEFLRDLIMGYVESTDTDKDDLLIALLDLLLSYKPSAQKGGEDG